MMPFTVTVLPVPMALALAISCWAQRCSMPAKERPRVKKYLLTKLKVIQN
jgi:hypothetical protein